MKGPTKIERIRSRTKRAKSSTIGTLPHPNGMIFWNECLMRSKTRVGRMRTEMHIDKELRALNTFFNNMLFSLKSGLPFLVQLP